MAILRYVACAGLTMTATLAVVRANNPEAADKAVQDIGGASGQMASLSGFTAGELLRSTGPVIAGGRDALQSSGLGDMLSPSTIPPASQPDPEP